MNNDKIYGDYLNRQATVVQIVSVINSCIETKKSTTFSIEAGWGEGKTWIIEKISDALEGFDISIKKQDILQNEANNILVIRYNAWEKDYYEEPLIAILITIINQLNKKTSIKNAISSALIELFNQSKDVLKNVLQSISKRIIGIDVVNILERGAEIAKSVEETRNFKAESDYLDANIETDIETVISALNKISCSTPIVFIVDELDRCLPEHAIKTLERLHHIFTKINSSVTVVSLNECQLRETVKKMFGDDTSFDVYMRKFLDFRLSLYPGIPNTEELQNKLTNFWSYFGEADNPQLCNKIVDDLCRYMPARDFEKVCNSAELCHKIINQNALIFPKEYAVSELLLFSCKIALEKEESISNILPYYENPPTSELGRYLKELLTFLPRNTYTNLSSSENKICYICIKGVSVSADFAKIYHVNIEPGLVELLNFYDKYIELYKIIKI
ncbi:MAG: hypothetical protein IJF14_01800 [Clostridia bacterium]|nr:hypothetical protein [Clostridia bacterium]